MDFDFISINEVLNSVANCSRVNSPMDSIESTMALSNEKLSDASKFYIAKSCGGYTEDELSNALRYQQGAGDLIEALMRHRHSRAGSSGFPIPRVNPTDKESTNPVTVSDLIYILQSPASWYQRIIYDSLAIRKRLLLEIEVSIDQLFKRAPDVPKVKLYHSINEDIEAASLRVGFERQSLIDWLEVEVVKNDLIKRAIGSSPTHRTKMIEQQSAILATLRHLGFDPLALPVVAANEYGAKSKAKLELASHPLFQAKTSFNKAWDDLRSTGEIGDEKQQKKIK